MKILGVDIGKHMGMVLWDTTSQGCTFNYSVEVADVREFGEVVTNQLRRLMPEVIVSAYPTRFYWTMISHAKKMGVMEYFAAQLDIPVVYTNDSSAKKTVFGQGKLTKEQIEYKLHAMGMNMDDEHQNDALMFTQWFVKSNKD